MVVEIKDYEDYLAQLVTALKVAEMSVMTNETLIREVSERIELLKEADDEVRSVAEESSGD